MWMNSPDKMGGKLLAGGGGTFLFQLLDGEDV